MLLRVTLNLDMKNARKAESIMKALIPDNVKFPEGLSLEMSANNNTLLLAFTCREGIRSMSSTIDEVLEHVSAMIKIIGDDNA